MGETDRDSSDTGALLLADRGLLGAPMANRGEVQLLQDLVDAWLAPGHGQTGEAQRQCEVLVDGEFADERDRLGHDCRG